MSSLSAAQIVLTAIILFVLIAGGISSFNHTDIRSGISQSNSEISGPADQNMSNQSYRIRVLWYDDPSRSYTFRDYTLSPPVLQKDWSPASLPPPDNSSLQRTPGMVKFLTWNGNVEQMSGTRYLTDQRKITEILNQYTLIASRSTETPTQTMGVTPSSTPIPPPSPGMLAPLAGKICNDNGIITASFGYLSRENKDVTVPVGDKNFFSPGERDRGQPDTFSPGIHESVFSISYPENSTNIIWNLMGESIEAKPVPSAHAAIRAEPDRGYVPLDITITDQSPQNTADEITPIWNTGAGTEPIRTGPRTYTYQYTQPGIYYLTLTKTGACGTTSASVQISAYFADYAYQKIAPEMRYAFSDLSSGDPTVWFWDFSDGSTSWERNPEHTFPGPGIYPVGLKVSGPNGSRTIVHTVMVP